MQFSGKWLDAPEVAFANLPAKGGGPRETVAIFPAFLKTQNAPKMPVVTNLPVTVPVVTPLATHHSEKCECRVSPPPNDSSVRSLLAEF